MSEVREMELRPLHPLDETGLCRVIRSALVEFGADRPGFAWQDPELDAMSKTYAASGWIYLVVAEGGNVLGGAGNVVNNLKTLGAEVDFISVVGSCETTKKLKEQLKSILSSFF